MRLLVVGDVHGRHARLVELLRQAQSTYRIRAAIQVGDFGFSPAVMEQFERDRRRFPVPVHVIDGNHEDHAWLARALRAGASARWQREANLVYQPRPSIAHLGASTVGFLGGALHVDRPQEHNVRQQSPNYILRREREQAVALFGRERPDLIVTHSCPSRIGIGLSGATGHGPGVAQHIVSAGFDPGDREDCGEAELTGLWNALTHKPRAWVFGHFHLSHTVTIDATRFACVSDEMDRPDRELLLWDTEEKKLLLCPALPGVS